MLWLGFKVSDSVQRVPHRIATRFRHIDHLAFSPIARDAIYNALLFHYSLLN